jgi:hypothetical protein
LPRIAPLEMWGGFGKGDPCNGCGEPIHPAQEKHEFKVHHGDVNNCRFHIGCAGLWQPEQSAVDDVREAIAASRGGVFVVVSTTPSRLNLSHQPQEVPVRLVGARNVLDDCDRPILSRSLGVAAGALAANWLLVP